MKKINLLFTCLTMLMVIMLPSHQERIFNKRVNLFDLTGKNASIIFSEPSAGTDLYFLYKAENGEMTIIPNTAIPYDESLSTEYLEEMYNVNSKKIFTCTLANAFFINIGNKNFLYTTHHGSDGLLDNRKRISADITSIDYENTMKNGRVPNFSSALFKGYRANFDFPQEDSIFIKGYIPDKKEMRIKFASIKGVAIKILKKDLPANFLNSKNNDLFENNMLVIKVEKDINLSGLSGAPAFNSKNEVVGIYSGRTAVKVNRDTMYYLSISLFH